MQALEPAAFVAAICDPGVRFETERFGRTRPGPGWRLDARRVDEHYLGCYLDGSVDAAAGGHAARLGPGGAPLVAPGEAHDLVPVDERFTFYHWRFRLWRGRRELRLATPAVLRAAVPRGLVLAEAAWDEQLTRQPFRLTRQRALLAAVIAELLREPAARSGGLEPDQRAAVLALVAARPPGAVHPATMAAACGLSHDWFTRRFRRSFGCAPRTWLLRERLRHAAEDLQGSTATIGAIAQRWGFDSVFVFSRQFKQRYGCSPSAWRRRS